MEVGVFVTFVVILVAIVMVLGLIACTFLCYRTAFCRIFDACGCCGFVLTQAVPVVNETNVGGGVQVRSGGFKRGGETTEQFL